MRQIMAEPQGAPEIVTDCLSFERKGCEGKNDAKCFATQIGPTPGPPPPCGMAKVLCKLRWHTSAQINAGFVRPTCAFIFAPSM